MCILGEALNTMLWPAFSVKGTVQRPDNPHQYNGSSLPAYLPLVGRHTEAGLCILRGGGCCG